MALSTFEKNKLENIDSLQIEYLSDLPVSEKDIVVIEPSNPIATTLRKYLANMGFENIFICDTPTEGLKNFLDFMNNEISVPIVIDDNIVNGNIKNVLTEVFKIQPRAKIIVTTTKESNQVSDLFNMGVMSIIHKPLNFEEVKKSVSEIFERNSDVKKPRINNSFDLLISTNSRLSFDKIKDMVKIKDAELDAIIKNAVDEGILIPDKEISEAACNRCNSVNISYISECPQCKGINFRQQNLIEHYKCGEVYPKERNYTTCPKCNKEIGSVGIDYREFSDYHICDSCNDRFPRPIFKFMCLECNNFFIEKLAVWKKSQLFTIKKKK